MSSPIETGVTYYIRNGMGPGETPVTFAADISQGIVYSHPDIIPPTSDNLIQWVFNNAPGGNGNYTIYNVGANKNLHIEANPNDPQRTYSAYLRTLSTPAELSGMGNQFRITLNPVDNLFSITPVLYNNNQELLTTYVRSDPKYGWSGSQILAQNPQHQSSAFRQKLSIVRTPPEPSVILIKSYGSHAALAASGNAVVLSSLKVNAIIRELDFADNLYVPRPEQGWIFEIAAGGNNYFNIRQKGTRNYMLVIPIDQSPLTSDKKYQLSLRAYPNSRPTEWQAQFSIQTFGDAVMIMPIAYNKSTQLLYAETLGAQVQSISPSSKLNPKFLFRLFPDQRYLHIGG